MSDLYQTPGLNPPPQVSETCIPMAGTMVDVYGIDELPSSGPITLLWLLHPRTQTRAVMNDIARRAVHAWHTQHSSTPSAASGTDGAGKTSRGEGGMLRGPKRGLVALCFDMPNHGIRMMSQAANKSWRDGNDLHALDMLGMVKGGTTDMRSLMDMAEGYLAAKVRERRRSSAVSGEKTQEAENAAAGSRVDAHVCLGWSLGGHAAWQAWMGEDRIDAAVVVVGCPDLMGLMSDRATKSKLDYANDFLGSSYFPPDLVNTCLANDPKGILFGMSPIPNNPLSPSEKHRLQIILDQCIRGKSILCLFGADDKLVPYKNSQPMLDLLQDATGSWYEEGRVTVEKKVYEGAGHEFSAPMVEDAIKFLVRVVGDGPVKHPRKAQL